MKHAFTTPLRLLPLLVALLAAAAGTVRAEITAAINSLVISNATSINPQTSDLIASDALNAAAGYDRDAIHVASTVQFTETVNGSNYDYELRYQLLNESDTVTPLRVGGSTVQQVVVARNNIGASTGNLADAADLTPAVQLLPAHEYRVRLTLWRRVTGSGNAFAVTTTSDFSQPRQFRHFNSTVSADADYNVRPLVTGVNWSQPWAVASSADRSEFVVTAGWVAGRYDGYLAAPANNDITLRFSVTLHEALTGVVVPLEQTAFEQVVSMPSHAAPVGQPLSPANSFGSLQMKIKPTGQLASKSKTYYVKVTTGHFATPGAGLATASNQLQGADQRLMHFTGVIRSGTLTGSFDSVTTPGPVAGAVIPAGLPVTGLRINAQSGTINGLAGYTFGDGSPLSVTLEDDGDALLSAGTVPVTGPPGILTTLGNMRFEKKNLMLTPAGAVADIALLLPAGLGMTSNPAATRIWESEVVFPNQVLTASFLPASPLLTKVGNTWACEESKPIWFEARQVQWSTAQSRLTFTTTKEDGITPGEAGFVRGAEINQLLTDAEVPLIERSKRSNDQVFWSANSTQGNVIVDADAQGTAKMTAQFGILGGSLRTHFPYDTRVIFGSGTLKMNADVVDTALSVLNTPTDITVPYAQDCGSEGCPSAAPVTANLVFDTPMGQSLHFTRDGGLASMGQLKNPSKLQWGKIEALGKFAHSTSLFTDSALHIPGCFLNGAGSITGNNQPGWMLHSGINQSNGSMVRPDTAAFELGTGDYAGLNFRTAGGTFTGTSVLAGVTAGPYDLSHRCKYVTRRAGVSGIHEAYTGSFPPGATLGGYAVQFEDFGIQLTHSQVTDSRTKGGIVVPEPAGFELAYDKMFFTCLGAPSGLELSPAETGADKTLVYWQADFRVKNAGFVPMAGAGCDPTVMKLSVSVEAWSSEIATPLYGTLAFHPSGQIQTGADPATEPAITSRLKLPPNLDMAGPDKERWAATTVGDAYFNHAPAAPGEIGWLNIAAKLDLPFFEDVPVHLHTRARKNDPGAVLHLMGGFQAPGSCFSIGAENFFTQEPFDVAHRGYANGVSVAQYRDGFDAPNDKFRMHAQTRWLDVVDLDYPMIWQVGSRTFKDFKEIPTDLLVLSLKHRCRALTPENADIDFGAKAGLNKLSLTSLAADKVSGLLDTLKGLDLPVLTAGREAIEQMLEPTMRGLFAGPLDAKTDEQAEKFLNKLFFEDNWDAATKTFKPIVNKAFIEGLLNAGGTDLAGSYQSVAGATSNVLGILKEVKDRLVKIKAHISDFREYSKPGPDNKFDSIAETAQRLAAKVSGKLDDPTYKEDIADLVARAKPVLTELDTLAAKAEQVCDGLLAALNGNGPLATELKDALGTAASEFTSAVGSVAGDLNTVLAPFRNGLDDPSHPQTRAMLRAKIREAMEDRFFSTGVSASINRILKQRLYDVEQQMRQVVDGVFEQADTAARDLIGTVLGGVDQKLTSFLGDAAGVMAGAEAKGKAHLRGDSLTDLRLDLIVELKASEAMKAHVFIEIKELNSDNTPGGCLLPGAMGTEVTLGAKEVALEWLYPDLSVSFDTRFQFAEGGKLTGMGGSIEVLGEISFGGQFVITEMGCAMMFGKMENYFSAEVAMEVGKGFKAKGGVYFGRTCTLAPFFWDQSIQEALGEAPFTGAYVYGEVHMALNQLIGIPSTCLFNLSVGAGTGVGYFTEGPTWIGKMFLSVEGEVLCIISVTGEISLVGVKNPQGLSLVGKGRLAAELGWCPVCISVEKTATLSYKNKKWSKRVD